MPFLDEVMRMVYDQVLHADLRDVCNERVGNPLSANPPSDSSPATLLRRAIAQSLAISKGSASSNPHPGALPPPSSSCPPTPFSLPPGYKLFLQLDESVDVSSNACVRAAHGSTSNASFANPSHYRNRVLKFCFCDGVTRIGGEGSSGGEEQYTTAVPVVGVELRPVPDLSTSSLGGVKLIIQNPRKVGGEEGNTEGIIIRAGVLMLKPNNVVILGGFEASLVKMQAKAVEVARKKYVEGDNTLRALCWNVVKEREGDEGDAGDEGSVREDPRDRMDIERQQQVRHENLAIGRGNAVQMQQ